MSETERLRRHWDKHARGYDKQIGWSERRFFPNTRRWVCSQAVGKVLELAIGTGLNLPQYPNNIRLTGIDLSPAMLAIAADRARQLRRDVDLRTGDAERLRFRDNSFDTVVCTFSLCAIPDEHRAIDEALRVLRPDGLLLLADHVRATVWWARSLQAFIDLITVPVEGEHYRRRPARHIEAVPPLRAGPTKHLIRQPIVDRWRGWTPVPGPDCAARLQVSVITWSLPESITTQNRGTSRTRRI